MKAGNIIASHGIRDGLGRSGSPGSSKVEQRGEARRPGEGHGRRARDVPATAGGSLGQPHLDLGVTEPDPVARLQDRAWHLGAADRDPVGRAEVHDLHERGR